MMLTVTIASALLALQPPLEVGECAAGRLPAADRQAVAASLRAGTAPAQEVVDRIVAQVNACRTGGGEPPEAAVASAVVHVAMDELGATLQSAGIDMTLVNRWFDRQSDAFKTNPMITPEQGEALVRELIADGVAEGPIPANAVLLGNYIGARIVMERIRRGLD